MLNWLMDWYLNNCNSDWEHSYGISIETLDNPGWSIKIDLAETPLEKMSIKYSLKTIGKDEWIGYKVENQTFDGSCSPLQLENLISIFKAVVMSPADFESFNFLE